MRTTKPDLRAQRRPDLVQRDFTAPAPDRLWVAHLSYIRCWEGLVFLAFVIDACSRRVVGWQLASHMRTTLVLDALRMALGMRRPGADVALAHHSDRGSQYTSIDYTQTLSDHGVLASVGSVGDAYENALAESFVDSFLDRADRRPRLALARPARARRRRVHRLVQPHQLHESLGDLRKETVEPLFSNTKQNCGVLSFHRRGRTAVLRSEWRLLMMTHNLIKLHRHRPRRRGGLNGRRRSYPHAWRARS